MSSPASTPIHTDVGTNPNTHDGGEAVAEATVLVSNPVGEVVPSTHPRHEGEGDAATPVTSSFEEKREAVAGLRGSINPDFIGNDDLPHLADEEAELIDSVHREEEKKSVLPPRIDLHVESNPGLTADLSEEEVFDRDSRLIQFVAGEDVDDELDDVEVGAAYNRYDDYDTIDWIRDAAADRADKVRFKASTDRSPLVRVARRMFYSVQGWLFVALIGILTGLLAGAVDVCVDWLSNIRFGFCRASIFLQPIFCCPDGDTSCAQWITWGNLFNKAGTVGYIIDYTSYVVLAVVFAGLAAFYVRRFSRWASGSGIPEVKTILGGFVIHMFASPQTLLIKTVGSVLSVASGLNLGKEGPMVHIASCWVYVLSRFFPKYHNNEAKKREMLSAAAAAGVAVAFGAPVGGILFSLEEVSYFFPRKTMWRSFLAAACAALVLQMINPYKTGNLVQFQVSYSEPFQYISFIPFIFIGICGGVIGAIFIKYNLKICELRRSSRLKKVPVLEVMVVAGVTALVSYTNPFLQGSANEMIGELFNECAPVSPSFMCDQSQWATVLAFLLIALFARLVLTIFTFGLKVPAGLFIPSLGMGACLGRALGIVLEQLVQRFVGPCSEHPMLCVSPGIYALIGGAAMLSGVTRMTVSLVVIMFELTGSLSAIVPVMVTVMTAKWVGDMITHEGIYDEHITLNEYPFLDHHADLDIDLRISEIMQPLDGVSSIYASDSNTVESLTHFATLNAFTGYPILTNHVDNLVLGWISRVELLEGLRRALKSRRTANTVCYFLRRPALHIGATSTLPVRPSPSAARRRGSTDGGEVSYAGGRMRTDSNDISVGGGLTSNHNGAARYGYMGASTDPSVEPDEGAPLLRGQNFSETNITAQTPWSLRRYMSDPFTVSPRTRPQTVLDHFKKLGLRYVIVVNCGKMLGILTKKDILQHIALERHHKRRRFKAPRMQKGVM